MGRAPCCEKVGLKKGRWTAEEDSKLINYIQINGQGSWRSLPKNAGLLRCGKSCRLRWINYLRTNLKRGNITPQEEELIIKLHSTLGNRWSTIAGELEGRTDNEIKNYWNSHLSRKIHSVRRPNNINEGNGETIVYRSVPPKQRRLAKEKKNNVYDKKNNNNNNNNNSNINTICNEEAATGSSIATSSSSSSSSSWFDHDLTSMGNELKEMISWLWENEEECKMDGPDLSNITSLDLDSEKEQAMAAWLLS